MSIWARTIVAAITIAGSAFGAHHPVPTAPFAPPIPSAPASPVSTIPFPAPDPGAVYFPAATPANAIFTGVYRNRTYNTMRAGVRYARANNISDTYIDIISVMTPPQFKPSDTQRKRIGTHHAIVTSMSSDGQQIGWQALWTEPGGIVVIVQIYDMDETLLDQIIPTIVHANRTLATRMITASDGSYQYQSASSRQSATAGGQGATGWRLEVFVPPGYPIPRWERRPLCWQLQLNGSGAAHETPRCDRGPSTVYLRPGDGTRIIAIVDPTKSTGTQTAIAVATIVWRNAADNSIQTDPGPVVSGRRTTLRTLGATVITASVPDSVCWVTLHHPPSNQPDLGEAFSRSDPDDPCTQVISQASVGRLTPVSSVHP